MPVSTSRLLQPEQMGRAVPPLMCWSGRALPPAVLQLPKPSAEAEERQYLAERLGVHTTAAVSRLPACAGYYAPSMTTRAAFVLVGRAGQVNDNRHARRQKGVTLYRPFPRGKAEGVHRTAAPKRPRVCDREACRSDFRRQPPHTRATCTSKDLLGSNKQKVATK